jgi:hypothetical protein
MAYEARSFYQDDEIHITNEIIHNPGAHLIFSAPKLTGVYRKLSASTGEWSANPWCVAPSSPTRSPTTRLRIHSMWAHQIGEPGFFSAPTLTGLYRKSSMRALAPETLNPKPKALNPEP